MFLIREAQFYKFNIFSKENIFLNLINHVSEVLHCILHKREVNNLLVLNFPISYWNYYNPILELQNHTTNDTGRDSY